MAGCSSASAPQEASPPERSVREGRLLPSSVAFWDADRGVLGAERTISTTDDGGRTWTVGEKTTRDVKWVTTFDERDAWAIAGRELLHSTDAGRTWRAVSRAPLISVAFTTGSEGWGIAGGTYEWRLVRTRDGGRHWQNAASPCPRVVSAVTGVSFPTLERGWLLCVGQPGAGQQQKAVFATRDGGETWVAVSGAIVGNESLGGGLGGYGYAEGIAFRADGTGLLWEGRGTLFLTRNGGRSWKAKQKITEPEIDFGFSASLPTDRVFYVLLQRGSFRLLRSEDGGRTWSAVHRWQPPKS